MNKTKPDPQEKERDEEGFIARLLKTRTIVIGDEIDKKMAQRVISQLLLLEQEDPKKPVKLFINSPGGDADAGFAIFDLTRFIKPDVKTICTGITASAAVIILLGAAKKNRYSLPNARILIHQPSTGVMGSAADIEIEASEILKFRDKINRLIAKETGQSIEKVENDTRRNFWMSGEEALKYGLISKIVTNREQLG
ncbi:MAG: ATP-dependent Clp protease proteolytic subunit [Candidatus Brocadiales bacterium]